MAAMTTCAKIPNSTMDRGVGENDSDDCVDDDDDLQAITTRFEVVTSDMRRDLPSGVRFLGSVNAVRVEVEGGEFFSGFLSVSLPILSLVLTV